MEVLKISNFFFLFVVGSQYYFVLNLTLVIKKFGGNDPLNTKKADCQGGINKDNDE